MSLLSLSGLLSRCYEEADVNLVKLMFTQSKIQYMYFFSISTVIIAILVCLVAINTLYLVALNG